MKNSVTEMVKEIALLIKAKDYIKRCGVEKETISVVSEILQDEINKHEEAIKNLTNPR